jgi:hypothetical protein
VPIAVLFGELGWMSVLKMMKKVLLDFGRVALLPVDRPVRVIVVGRRWQ